MKAQRSAYQQLGIGNNSATVAEYELMGAQGTFCLPEPLAYSALIFRLQVALAFSTILASYGVDSAIRHWHTIRVWC